MIYVVPGGVKDRKNGRIDTDTDTGTDTGTGTDRHRHRQTLGYRDE